MTGSRHPVAHLTGQIVLALLQLLGCLACAGLFGWSVVRLLSRY